MSDKDDVYEEAYTEGTLEYDGVSYIMLKPMTEGKMIAQMRGWGWLQYKGEDVAIAEQHANAERLALCWNACNGIKTKALRKYIETCNSEKPIASMLLALEDQRVYFRDYCSLEVETLKQTEKWFIEYAENHKKSGKFDKARVNYERARFCRNQINNLEEAIHEYDESKS